jgi:hypothetical protein
MELRNSYFVIGTSLLNPRPKDPRDEIALATQVALAKYSLSLIIKIKYMRNFLPQKRKFLPDKIPDFLVG